MSITEKPSPEQKPAEKGNQETVTNPGNHGNDTGQTPDKEVNNPPTAVSDKNKKPWKIGFSSQLLLF